jgi:hypothetical protein
MDFQKDWKEAVVSSTEYNKGQLLHMRLLYYAKKLEAPSTKQEVCIWFWQYARKGKCTRKSRMYLLWFPYPSMQSHSPPAKQKLYLPLVN